MNPGHLRFYMPIHSLRFIPNQLIQAMENKILLRWVAQSHLHLSKESGNDQSPLDRRNHLYRKMMKSP